MAAQQISNGFGTFYDEGAVGLSNTLIIGQMSDMRSLRTGKER
jgi:hypothetical protein